MHWIRLYYRDQNKISNNIFKLLILYYVAVVELLFLFTFTIFLMRINAIDIYIFYFKIKNHIRYNLK